MSDLNPELRAALRTAWHEATARGTGLPQNAVGDATVRAELVYGIICFLRDEAKFRTAGPAEEREQLAKVGDAARGYADALFALRDRPGTGIG
ncbi:MULTISPECIES: hypothetical protein [Streptomyces albidoflavus group]|uniref:hypothetical protein n=1 Tax=Streptomyces albidoflavus group TaxID=1477431 RepID=UPI001160BF03|nr:hypothetical protein [Streptomyces sampsonii]NEC96244.1 hypothetical protein [Streptomyces albidoflavus]